MGNVSNLYWEQSLTVSFKLTAFSSQHKLRLSDGAAVGCVCGGGLGLRALALTFTVHTLGPCPAPKWEFPTGSRKLQKELETLQDANVANVANVANEASEANEANDRRNSDLLLSQNRL